MIDGAAAAAEVMIAFWLSPRSLDVRTRDICSRIEAAVDPAGSLEAAVRADSGNAADRVAAAIRRANREDAELRGVLERLASPDQDARSTVQNVTVGGNGNVGIVVGRDFIIDGDRSSLFSRWMARISHGHPSKQPADRASVRTPDTILLAAADPSDLVALRLGQEAREIREAIELSGGRAAWTVQLWMSVRLRDLSRALLQLRPRVVHFSGHGSSDGVFLEDAVGESHLLATRSLVGVFAAAEAPVECVILNACYSETQARALSEVVRFVIGLPDAVTDEAAIAFSIGFYQALGEGKDIHQAFGVGRAHADSAETAGYAPPVLIERG